MRFKKVSLVAASLLLSALPSFAVDTVVTPSPTDMGGFVILAGDRLIYEDGGSYGVVGALVGGGDFVKNGAGLLQYTGFSIYDTSDTALLTRARLHPGQLTAEGHAPRSRDGIPPRSLDRAL